MAPVLFLFVMQAAIDTFKKRNIQHRLNSTTTLKPSTHESNKENKQAAEKAAQRNPTRQQTPHVDDGVFITAFLENLLAVVQDLQHHPSRFRLIMHVGTERHKSKTEAMHFPSHKYEAKKQTVSIPVPLNLNEGRNNIHFVKQFKYLGSIISNDLSEDADTAARIKRAKSLLGALRHFC